MNVTVCVALYVFLSGGQLVGRQPFSGSLPRVILILCLFSSNC